MGPLKIGITIFSLLNIIGLIIPTWTPKIKGDHSISSLEQVEINGTKLEVMIRGIDQSKPIIIFVHGGPGCSEIPYVRKYQDLLENSFTIVHYDQRGSGKSYHFFEDYSNLTTDLHVDDLLALTDYLKKKFSQKKVLLVGHSFGTYIAMQAAYKSPDKFVAYIGIGQVSDPKQSEIDSLEYTISQAKLADNASDVKKLETLRDSIEKGEKMTPKHFVRKYGGAARLIHDHMDYFLGFLFNPEYNLFDVVRYGKGFLLSHRILLAEEKKHSITRFIDRLDIPCYFVMGKYDYVTSVDAAKDYFKQLKAPVKDFVVFEKSAHFPQFEEKEQFASWLNKTWRNLER